MEKSRVKAQPDLPNNTRPTLLRDSSQNLLGTNIQAIPTFTSIHLHLFLHGSYSASPPLSCVKISLKRADYLSPRGPHSATSHRRSLNTSQRRSVQAELFDPHRSHRLQARHSTSHYISHSAVSSSKRHILVQGTSPIRSRFLQLLKSCVYPDTWVSDLPSA